MSHTICGIFCWSCCFTSRLAAFSKLLLMKLTWPGSHTLVTLLLIYSATKKARMILHDATLGTFVRGVYLLWCGSIDTLVKSELWTFLKPGVFASPPYHLGQNDYRFDVVQIFIFE